MPRIVTVGTFDGVHLGHRRVLEGSGDLAAVQDRACAYLRESIDDDGRLRWEERETSTAKFNLWTYLITGNVLWRRGGEANQAAAARVLGQAFRLRTASGLLPMRDRGEEITECAFMQADMLLFLERITSSC